MKTQNDNYCIPIAGAMPRLASLILAPLSRNYSIVAHSGRGLIRCFLGTFTFKAGSSCLQVGTTFAHWTSLATNMFGAVQTLASVEREVPFKRRCDRWVCFCDSAKKRMYPTVACSAGLQHWLQLSQRNSRILRAWKTNLQHYLRSNPKRSSIIGALKAILERRLRSNPKGPSILGTLKQTPTSQLKDFS